MKCELNTDAIECQVWYGTSRPIERRRMGFAARGDDFICATFVSFDGKMTWTRARAAYLGVEVPWRARSPFERMCRFDLDDVVAMLEGFRAPGARGRCEKTPRDPWLVRSWVVTKVRCPDEPEAFYYDISISVSGPSNEGLFCVTSFGTATDRAWERGPITQLDWARAIAARAQMNR